MEINPIKIFIKHYLVEIAINIATLFITVLLIFISYIIIFKIKNDFQDEFLISVIYYSILLLTILVIFKLKSVHIYYRKFKKEHKQIFNNIMIYSKLLIRRFGYYITLFLVSYVVITKIDGFVYDYYDLTESDLYKKDASFPARFCANLQFTFFYLYHIIFILSMNNINKKKDYQQNYR